MMKKYRMKIIIKKKDNYLLISVKLDFRAKKCYQGQKSILHNGNESIHQNNHPKCKYANNRTSKYVKKILTELKGEIDKFIIVIE